MVCCICKEKPATVFYTKIEGDKTIKVDVCESCAKSKGAKVAAYGAAAKGATLLNYGNVTTDLVVLVADRSPHKQHRFMPGCHLPILPPEAVIDQMPDYLLILPWNLRKEIMGEMDIIREWGGRFVTAIPKLEIVP